MDRARSIEYAEEMNGLVQESRWTDADIAFDVGLENWDTGDGDVPVPEVPKRLFKAWIEDWEWECIHDNDTVSETKLLTKYKGMRWIDPDVEHLQVLVAVEDNMEYQGGRNGEGWCVIGTRESDGAMEPWPIDVVIDLMGEYEQPTELNVEIEVDEVLRAANKERLVEEEEKRQTRKREIAKKRKRK
jgi:hypothetical protein